LELQSRMPALRRLPLLLINSSYHFTPLDHYIFFDPYPPD
jgi:hypothetical protein